MQKINIDCYYMQRNLYDFELHPKKINVYEYKNTTK